MTYRIILATEAGTVYGVLHFMSPEATWATAEQRLAIGRRVFVYPNPTVITNGVQHP